MARKSLIARDDKRRKLVEKYKKIREELKANGDYDALQRLPKNSSPGLFGFNATIRELEIYRHEFPVV